jgi:hypothetical protein
MKVKIITKDSSWELQNEINNWLKRNGDSNIIDIKYTGNGNAVPYGSREYSAMIIYK